MTYHVLIPSYGRATTIWQDTITTLIQAEIPPDRITVLAGPTPGYPAALTGPPGIRHINVPAGLRHVNNWINEHHHGQWIIRADDDLRKVVRLIRNVKGKPAITPVTDLHTLFSNACDWADDQAITLWGIDPTANPGFMRHQWKTGLYFVFGALFGYRPGHPCQLSAKDDYERSLLHFTADGAVGRLSDIAVQPRPMRAYPGGLQTELTDRRAAEHTATAELKARWPHLIQDKPTRDGYPEIALRLPSLRVQRGGRP